MTIFAATDYRIEINSVNVSTWCRQAELSISVEELESQTFGDTWTERIGGLRSASVTFEFLQSFAASNVDATLWPLLGTVVNCRFRPTSGTISATNPEYRVDVLISQYQPFSESVGELGTVSVTFPTSGAVTRVTS